jgi:hypothetical protein
MRLSNRPASANRGVWVAAALCAGLLLTACMGSVRQVPVDVDGGPAAARAVPTGFEGDWISADRVAVSRFAGGVFTTTATDTGNKLADGSYAVTDPRTAQITVVSRIRNTTSNVTCLLATPSQLNCTSSTGQQFVLTRRV